MALICICSVTWTLVLSILKRNPYTLDNAFLCVIPCFLWLHLCCSCAGIREGL